MTARATYNLNRPGAHGSQPGERGLRRVRWLTSMLALLASLAGCMDGPFYHMKRANPFFQKQFNKDRALGTTFEERLEELALVEASLPSMSPEQQQAWARQLERLVTQDPSPEMRARAIKVVATLPYPEAERALNSSSADSSEKVRLAACKAWKQRGGEQAQNMLASLAVRAEETTSVRQAAIEALAAFDNAEVRAQMSQLLDDSSPAIQYQVAQSLKGMTGRDYGGDFASWKQFLAGNDVPPPAPKSITATLWENLPGVR